VLLLVGKHRGPGKELTNFLPNPFQFSIPLNLDHTLQESSHTNLKHLLSNYVTDTEINTKYKGHMRGYSKNKPSPLYHPRNNFITITVLLEKLIAESCMHSFEFGRKRFVLEGSKNLSLSMMNF